MASLLDLVTTKADTVAILLNSKSLYFEVLKSSGRYL